MGVSPLSCLVRCAGSSLRCFESSPAWDLASNGEEKNFEPSTGWIILTPMRTFNERQRRWRPVGGLLLAVLAGVALLATGQQPPPPPPSGGTLRVEVEVVNVYCTVKDTRGALVTDLAAIDFEVREDGKKQELRYFARETDRPLTLGLLVDTSGSQVRVLPVEKQTMTQFLRQVLRASDLALLITFDLDVDLLQDFTSEADQLELALHRARINAPGNPVNPGPLPTSGTIGTRLYDAVYLATKQKLGPEVGRKALIVISDGMDFGSQVTLKQAIEAAQRADTMIYTIGVADPQFYGGQGAVYSGRGPLEELARETGGRAIFPSSPEKLQEAFAQIAAELRSQYSLGYTPTNRARDGRFRKIEIKVNRPGMRVQARRGYYAPGS